MTLVAVPRIVVIDAPRRGVNHLDPFDVGVHDRTDPFRRERPARIDYHAAAAVESAHHVEAAPEHQQLGIDPGQTSQSLGIQLVVLVPAAVDQTDVSGIGRDRLVPELLQQALDCLRSVGDLRQVCVNLGWCGHACNELGDYARAEALLAGAEPMAGDLGEQWLDLLAAYAKFLIARSDPGAGAAVARALTAHEELLGPSHPSVIALREIAQGS